MASADGRALVGAMGADGTGMPRAMELPRPGDWTSFLVAERPRRRASGGRRFVRHAILAWAALALVVLALPILVELFGSQKKGESGTLSSLAPLPRLDLAGRLVAARLDEVQSDLRWAGAAVWATRYLRDPAADRRAAAADVLQGFVSTREWCTRIVLAAPTGAPLSARRGGEPFGCATLLAIAGAVSPGTVLLDRVPAASGTGTRLCFGLPIASDGAGAAALVVEGDPTTLFADVAALSAGDAGTFLADGQGRWLLAPPPGVGALVREGLALSSWQGPAGGRWQVAVQDPARTGEPGAVPPVHEGPGWLLLAAVPLAIVIAQAIRLRRKWQRSSAPVADARQGLARALRT